MLLFLLERRFLDAQQEQADQGNVYPETLAAE